MSPTAQTRRAARERAVALLYEAESKGVDIEELLASLPLRPDPFAVVLVEGVRDHRTSIDAVINRLAEGWTINRMPAIDRALLRLGVFELCHTSVPAPVAINEAVELANVYSTEDSGRFVNGVLAQVAATER